MGFATDFADLLPDTVVLRPRTGQDAYGKPTYGSPVTVSGRLVQKQKLVRASTGAEVVSSALVRLPYVAGFTAEGQLIVNGIEQPVLAVESAPDETGTPYYTLVRIR